MIWKCSFESADYYILYLSVVLGDEVPIAQFLFDMFETVDGISQNLKQYLIFNTSYKIIERSSNTQKIKNEINKTIIMFDYYVR